ncbi:uncharacterized protein LOC132600550 [Lycium barbarum]|uniref:uncharacterized protein LOC132599682 n=1 Tax=Lycium barbarum TaxID=112863 RepID=UPI00293E56F5|nr:uncharacterized protein LOC132599682 [Lycium barbarum]XP_060169766.1 uncharacterized protein LOC132600550 [Lycium barbarum]
MENPEEHREWVASVIASGTPPWLDLSVSIEKNTFNREAKFWLSLISSRVIPSKHNTDIPITKCILIASLMFGYLVDVGVIIRDEIKTKSTQKGTSLPFPCLITELCLRKKVRDIPRVDRMLQVEQTINYTMLEPGTRKRKRVSSEPRASGTTLDAHILEPEDLATDDAETAPSTAPQAPGADPPSSSTTVPAAPVPPSTTAARGVSIEGMRVLRAADAKVNWLVERLPDFVKEAIEAAMAPYTQAITDIRKEQDKIKEHVRHIDRRLEQIEGAVRAAFLPFWRT